MLKPRSFLIGLLGLLISHSLLAASFVENFSTDPLQHGWNIFGDTNLFQWDSTNQDLHVTWNSAQSNSYFYRPLGTVLARDSDFTVAFDLQLSDIGPGPDTNKASSFQIAIGFLNLDQATKTNFFRGTGSDSPNLAEFTYFWDSGFGATTWPVLIDTNSTFNYNGASDYAIFALTAGDWYHVAMSYSASTQTLIATATNFENTSSVRIVQPINASFGDFRVGSFSVSSYSDAGQEPQFAGSVLAHGTIDNIAVTMPDPPLSTAVISSGANVWQAQFLAQSNWVYSLQKSTDFRSWAEASAPVLGAGAVLTLSDTNLTASSGAFYRGRANRL